MELRLEKCLFCSLLCTNGNVIRLIKSKAALLEEVFGVKLTAVNSESVLCQTCFQKLLRYRDSGVKPSDQDYIEIQRILAAEQRMSNEPAVEPGTAIETLECDICGRRCQMNSMRIHMLKHSNESKSRCSKYGISYKRKDEPTEHKKTHDKRIDCETCRKKFTHHQHLKLHQMHHRHGSYAATPEESFECNRCDKTFSTPQYLQQHQKQVHEKNEVKCGICEKSFKNRTYLLQHSKTHDKDECAICHKLVSKNKMSSHVRTHVRKFGCDLCAYSGSTKFSLTSHKKRKHQQIPM